MEISLCLNPPLFTFLGCYCMYSLSYFLLSAATVCRTCICCSSTKFCNFLLLKKWEAILAQIFKGHLIMRLQSNVLIYIYIRKPLAWLCFQHQKSAEADETHNFIRLFTSFQISFTVYYFFDWLSSFMFHPNCIFNIQILLLVFWRVCIFNCCIWMLQRFQNHWLSFFFVFQYQSDAQ